MASIAALRDLLIRLQRSDRRLALEPLLFQCLHQHNNRLGVAMTEEVYLLFLLQRTLTEIAEGKNTQ